MEQTLNAEFKNLEVNAKGDSVAASNDDFVEYVKFF